MRRSNTAGSAGVCTGCGSDTGTGILAVNIYKDSTAYSNGSPEVESLSHTCSGTDFTTYFAETVLDDVGETLLTKSYDWLLTLPMYTGASEV